MPVPLSFVAVVLTVAVFFTAWWVLVAIPECVRSIYLCQLWAARDELVDGVLLGRIPDTERARRNVERMEAMLHLAEDITPFRLLVGVAPIIVSVPRKLRGMAVRMSDEIPEPLADAVLLRFNNTLIRGFLFSSPSGWLVSIVAFAVVLPLATLTGRAAAMKRTATEAFLSAASALSTAYPVGHRELRYAV